MTRIDQAGETLVLAEGGEVGGWQTAVEVRGSIEN